MFTSPKEDLRSLTGGSELRKLRFDSPYSMRTGAARGAPERDLTHLEFNESSRNPPFTLRAALASYRIGRYPTPELRDEVIAQYAKHLSTKEITISENQVELFHGSDALLEKLLTMNALETLNHPGKNNRKAVLVVGPTYLQFASLSDRTRHHVYEVRNPNPPFTPHLEDIIQALKETVPAFCYICNPNNPTGFTFKKQEISKLLTLATKTTFIIDEAYVEFKGESALGLLHECNNLVISRTFSKAYGLADQRIGFSIASPETIKSLETGINTKDVNTLSLTLARSAISSADYAERYAKEVETTKTIIGECLSARGIAPIYGGGNFISFIVPPERKQAFLQRLLEFEVVIRDLSTHHPGLVRVTIDPSLMREFINAFPVKAHQNQRDFSWLDRVNTYPFEFWPRSSTFSSDS